MQNGVRKTRNRCGPAVPRGATLLELLMLLLAFVSAIAGAVTGAKLGASYGVLVACLGGVVGFAAGIAGALLFTLLAAFAYEPVERFHRLWRPYPPRCENGTCVGLRHYSCIDNPEQAIAAMRGLSRIGWRCRCGHLYAGGYEHGLRNRWVRVLPDGTIRPYLIHRTFGRWRPDPATTIEAGALERTIDRIFSTKIPGWTVPFVLTVISTVIAVAVVDRTSGFAHPIAPYFIAGCGAIGLVSGCIALWFGADRFKDTG